MSWFHTRKDQEVEYGLGPWASSSVELFMSNVKVIGNLNYRGEYVNSAF